MAYDSKNFYRKKLAMVQYRIVHEKADYLELYKNTLWDSLQKTIHFVFAPENITANLLGLSFFLNCVSRFCSIQQLDFNILNFFKYYFLIVTFHIVKTIFCVKSTLTLKSYFFSWRNFNPNKIFKNINYYKWYKYKHYSVRKRRSSAFPKLR